MQTIDFTTIISLVLGLLATFAGGYMLIFKKKLKEAVSLIKESYELLVKVEQVISDDKVSKEEVEQVKKEALDVRDAFKLLISKNK